MSSISNSLILQTLFVIAPQFATTDPTKLAGYNFIIDNVLRSQVNESVLGCNALMAYVYLLGHMLQLQANPNLGVNSSLSEGDLSIGIAVTADSSILNATSYGREYKDLVKRTVVGTTVTNLPVQLGGVNQYVPNEGCGCGFGYGGY